MKRKILVMDDEMVIKEAFDFRFPFFTLLTVNVLLVGAVGVLYHYVKHPRIVTLHKNVIVEKLVEDIPLTDSAIVKELITLDCILPNVALAQIKTESDHYKSTITKDNKNIAGIKTSNSKYVTGMKHEHCTYATYRDCLRDYVRIQNRYLKNIDGRYAMSTNYINTLKQIK
jgi:hypothetical protein